MLLDLIACATNTHSCVITGLKGSRLYPCFGKTANHLSQAWVRYRIKRTRPHSDTLVQDKRSRGFVIVGLWSSGGVSECRCLSNIVKVEYHFSQVSFETFQTTITEKEVMILLECRYEYEIVWSSGFHICISWKWESVGIRKKELANSTW